MKKTFVAASIGALALIAAACAERNDPLAPNHVLVPNGVSRALLPITSTEPRNGSIYTTEIGTCGHVNGNVYATKSDIGLDGGPHNGHSGSGLVDGYYGVQVTNPSGSVVLGTSVGTTDEMPVHVTNGVFDFCYQLEAIVRKGTTDVSGGPVAPDGFDTTPNGGGEYKVWVSNGSDFKVAKTDNFKVQADCTIECGGGIASTLGISKDASGAYTNTYAWTIAKDVDQTIVKQIGGSATFNYTVTVTHDGGTVSGVKITGTISVFNPNVDGSVVLPVSIISVTDQLSDGTNCTVTNGGAQSLTLAQTDFAYECDLAALPQGQLDNIATVTWGDQTLTNSNFLAAGNAAFTFSDVSFAETAVDECTNVTDTYAGSLGTVCVGDANPTTYNYSRTIPVPQWDCLTYDNTASFTTNDSGATDSASQTVTVCGPARTGALTMGFWQNKNGQGIITGQAKTGVCPSATWLRQFAPFQDLSATATCAQVGTYVTTVIKAANASGAAMNAMLKAQMLATALDVYFSDPALGGNKIGAPAPIGGVTIDLTQVCKNIGGGCTIFENTSAAFGGATSLTVSQLLAYAASQSNAGGSSWYGQVKATQELAKDTFDAINNQVAFAGP